MDSDLLNKLKECEGFDWDKANIAKNWDKHGVSQRECEEIFFNEPFVVANDENHSKDEERFFSLGKTNNGRRLFLVFTIRNKKVRVISARDMSLKERKEYAKYEKKTDTKF